MHGQYSAPTDHSVFAGLMGRAQHYEHLAGLLGPAILAPLSREGPQSLRCRTAIAPCAFLLTASQTYKTNSTITNSSKKACHAQGQQHATSAAQLDTVWRPAPRSARTHQPGGQLIWRPPMTCRCKWYTDWQPLGPSLTTTRYPWDRPSCLATCRGRRRQAGQAGWRWLTAP